MADERMMFPAKRPFKCVACGCEHCERGVMNANYLGSVVFTSSTSSWWTRACSAGVGVQAVVCRACGFVHQHVDVVKMDEQTGGAETRCRKCRYILRGITEPRCPECGERI